MTHSKSGCALQSLRLSLALGASVAALSIMSGAAFAQSVTAYTSNGGAPSSGFVTVTTGALDTTATDGALTGMRFTGSSSSDFTDLSGGNVTVNGSVLSTTITSSGGITVAPNAGQTAATTTINSAGISTTSANGLNSLTVNNSGTTITGATTTNGLTNATGNIVNSGNYTSTSGNITLTNGNITTTNGTVSGAMLSSGSGGNLTTITGGAITSTGTITGGAVTSNGLLTSTGGATIGGGATTITSANGSNSLTVNNSGTAITGQTTVNNFAVTNGSTVSMGGNRVQDVATPVAATDAANKAYVDEEIAKSTGGVNRAYVDRGLSKANEGTAIALAISQPVFLPGQTFAVRAGWGGYEDQNAFGFSMAGVIAHDVFGSGSTVSLDGGFGVGGNYNTVAGKAGLTIGFGGGYTSLK